MTLTESYLTNLIDCGYVIHKCFAYRVKGRMMFGLLIMRGARSSFSLKPTMGEAFSDVISDIEGQGRHRAENITSRCLGDGEDNDLLNLLNA